MALPIAILLYHRIDLSGDSTATPPAVFERHLAWLSSQGYRSLTLEDFDHAISVSPRIVPKKEVLLTFDDGYPDLANVVAPALRRHGFTGVAFLITGACQRAGDAASTNRSHVSWDQARALASDGVIEFQSHSHSHKRWDTKPGAHAEIACDLADSVDMLTSELRLPRKYFRHLAWPWGSCNEAWEVIGKNAGLTSQHIVQRGAVTRMGQTTRLPRICCDGIPAPTFRAWMSVLSTPAGARLCNTVFGSIRGHRHGLGYF